MAELYNVVFQGRIRPEFELSQVKENVGKMFGASGDKLNMMFSGKAVMIKKEADRPTAEKYVQALHKAGAVAQVRTVTGEVVEFTAVQQQAPSPSRANASSSKRRVKSTKNLTMAEVGAQLAPTRDFTEAEFDLSGMTMAPVGTTVLDAEPPPPSPQLDLSSLSMAEAGERILDPAAPPAETKGQKLEVEFDD